MTTQRRLASFLQKVGGPSPTKSRRMLVENRAHGRKLTKRQKRFFGFILGTARRLTRNPDLGK